MLRAGDHRYMTGRRRVVAALHDAAPLYDRPMRRPDPREERPAQPVDLASELCDLVMDTAWVSRPT